MSGNPKEMDKLALARSLVELAWDSGSIPQTIDIEYEGADWEVVVRIKSTEDGDLPSSSDSDFTEQLPE
jgi:hypothetical protein